MKSKFNLYNISIVALIVIVISSILFIVGYLLNKNNIHPFKDMGQKIENATTNDTNREEKARNSAAKKFKELGEKNVKASDLEVIEIQRSGEKYYYIASGENTLEIRQSDNKITRVNSVIVE